MALSSLKKNTHSNSLKNKFINVGETITRQQGFMKGHGVIVRDGNLVACVAGFIEQTNKLIFVRPIKTRYVAEVGDVIVGRVSEIGDKYWCIDIGSQTHSTLVLSAIHLPGGVHRRRTEEDALEMRSFFKEGDLISAEIQSLRKDGGVNLQTRNLKYGKLINGMFVKVHSCLVKRTSKHFIPLDKHIGIDMILGNNGYIWMTNSKDKEEVAKIMNFAKQYKDFTPFLSTITAQVRINMCRLRNSLLLLNTHFIQISHNTVMSVYTYSVKNNIAPKDMMNEPQSDLVQDALFIVQQSL